MSSDLEIAAKSTPANVEEYHEAITSTLAGQHAEVREFLEGVYLGQFADALLAYGIDSLNDLADEELLHNSVLTSLEIGMRSTDVQSLRRGVHELNGGELQHSEFVLRSQQRLCRLRNEQVSLHEEGKALARLVKDRHYSSGEADCIRANYRSATLSWGELCGVVIESGDTIFHFDVNVCEKLFDVIDDDKSGQLTVDEILGAGDKPAVAEYVRDSRQPTLGHLIRHQSGSKASAMQAEGVRKAFMGAVDGDGDGAVDKAEWNQFIENLRHQRIVYIKQYMLIKRKCYNGKGMKVGYKYANPLGLVSNGWLPRGYLEDFWYYACNNHQVLMLFFTDKDNPFTPYERRVDFVVSVSVTLLGASLLLLFKERMIDNMTSQTGSNGQLAASIIASLVAAAFVSVPVMLARQAGFYLVGCPCLLQDVSTLDEKGAKRYALFRRLEEVAADTLLVVGLCLCACAGLVFTFNHSRSSAAYWVLDVALFFPQTWAWWFLQTALVEFNPSKNLQFWCTCGGKLMWCKFLTAGAIGIGQWQDERSSVLACVRSKILERGEEHFMTDKSSSFPMGGGDEEALAVPGGKSMERGEQLPTHLSSVIEEV